MLETTLKKCNCEFFYSFHIRNVSKNYIGYIDIKDGKSSNYIEIELIRILCSKGHEALV